jgi:predicted esterase
MRVFGPPPRGEDRITRLSTTLIAAAAAICMTAGDLASASDRAAGRLASRPGGGRSEAAAPIGLSRLDARGERSALLYVPASYRPDRPAPLLLVLHGAGGTGEESVRGLIDRADAHGTIIVAPTSRAPTWDVAAQRRFGPDVEAIDRLLADVFERYAVDKAHLAIAGFSDGASYALSLGLSNGDLFSHVIAFSPGFMAPARKNGKPRFFVSHGRKDRVLPIDRCSRILVPQLRKAGYDVEYFEFGGGHGVPPEALNRAFAWLRPPKR